MIEIPHIPSIIRNKKTVYCIKDYTHTFKKDEVYKGCDTLVNTIRIYGSDNSLMSITFTYLEFNSEFNISSRFDEYFITEEEHRNRKLSEILS